MEKKIAICFLMFLGVVSCTPENNKVESQSSTSVAYDSIFYANDRVKPIEISGAENINHGIAYKTNGANQSIWIDSVYYFQSSNGKHIVLYRTPENETQLLYFNGDSSVVEKVALNSPMLSYYKLNNSKVLNVIDSSQNSGFLIVSHLYYQINNEGIISSRREYFPQKAELSKEFDFSITNKLKGDTLEIFKNNIIDFKFY